MLHVLRVVPFGYALGFKDNCSFLMYLFNVFALPCICIVFLDFICTVVYLHCLFYVFADRPVVGLGRRLWIPVRDPGIGTPHCSTHICQIYFLFQIRKMQNTKIQNNNFANTKIQLNFESEKTQNTKIRNKNMWTQLIFAKPIYLFYFRVLGY